MANQLINRSGLDAARQIEPKQETVARVKRAYRYRSDCPKGEIFVGKEAIAAADEDGWVDSPTKVGGVEPPPEPESPEQSEPEPEGDEDAGE